MAEITAGKFRSLMRLTAGNGKFCILALDHQDALRRAIKPDQPQTVTDAALVEFKRDVAVHLQPSYSGLLVDPVWGAATAADHVAAGQGLILELEKADYDLNPIPLKSEIRPHWGVSKIKRMSADGVKLFFYYHPDHLEHAAIQDAIVRQAAVDCAHYDIPLFAEPIRYPLDGEDSSSAAYAADTTRIVVESARRTAALGADVLKLEFPLDVRHQPHFTRWLESCRAITDAVDVPWVLLSAGVDFETFARQLEAAVESGAVGFIAGRAVWGEACALHDRDQRAEWLSTVGHERMQRLRSITMSGSAAWSDFLRPEPMNLDWHKRYEEM